MSAHTLASTIDTSLGLGGFKVAVITVTGSASYDAGGSLLDLSSIFPSKCYGVTPLGISPHGSAKYRAAYVPAAANAPATGKVKIHDITAASGAEASGDLSATTLTLLAFGK